MAKSPCKTCGKVSLSRSARKHHNKNHNKKLTKIAMASGAFLGERHQRARAGMALGQAIEELGVRKETDGQLESPGNGAQDVGLQGALAEAHMRRLEEAEGSRGQADLLKLQELEAVNSQLRADLEMVRQAEAGGREENRVVSDISEQSEALQKELIRKREECLQLQDVVASLYKERETAGTEEKELRAEVEKVMEGLLNHYHLTEAKIFSTGKAHQQQGPVFDTTSLPALMEKPAEAKKFLAEMRQQISVEPIGTKPVAELPPDNWVKEGGAKEEKKKQFKVQNPKKAEAVVQ